MVIIIVLNLIFGVIIDTFADLRSEKQKKEEILKTTCFICGESARTTPPYTSAVETRGGFLPPLAPAGWSRTYIRATRCVLRLFAGGIRICILCLRVLRIC